MITTGFETGQGPPWLPFFNQGAGATFTGGAGNPGTFADITLNLLFPTPIQAGLTAQIPSFTVIGPPPLSTVVISADYRYFAGSGAELWPTLVQLNAIFRPAQPIPLPATGDWTGTGSWSFPISSFTNSGGVPFSIGAPTQIGFSVRVPAPVPGVTNVRVGNDNLTLGAIPSPGAATLWVW